jgi:hypothetical protein
LTNAARQKRWRDKRKARIAELEAAAKPSPKPKPTAARTTAEQESARNEALLRQLRAKQAEIEKLTVPKPPVSESARNAALLKRNDLLLRKNKALQAENSNLKSTYRQYLEDQERHAHQGRRVLVLPKKVQSGILRYLHPDRAGPNAHPDELADRNALTAEFLSLYPRNR